MKKFLFLSLLLMSCFSSQSHVTKVRFTEDVKLDKDQILVCPFVLSFNAMECMGMDEFLIRTEPKDP